MAAFVYNKQQEPLLVATAGPKKLLSKPFFCSKFSPKFLSTPSFSGNFRENSSVATEPQPPGATAHPPEATLAPLDVILDFAPACCFWAPLCNFGPLYAWYVGCAAPGGALYPFFEQGRDPGGHWPPRWPLATAPRAVLKGRLTVERTPIPTLHLYNKSIAVSR